MTNDLNLHAHVDTYSQDCDGGHGNDYIMAFSDQEIAEREGANGVNDFSDIHFTQRVMNNVASPYGVEYGMEVLVDSEGIRVTERTDEGYRSANVRWCRDEHCDPNYHTVSDQYAEMMGY